ncbi:MAG: hypothetical protein IKJ87_04670 [Ruminococcus sp.]|nr:hypothetical protein [Ruminococcus sp.]
MKKNKRFSVLKLLIVILCITSVIVSAGINVLFAGGKTPEIFGRHIYVVGEDNPMSGSITTGSALIAMDAEKINIATGDIVLCYPSDAPEALTLRSVSFIAEADDGSFSYYTMDSYHEDTTGSITKDKIVAVCTGYTESHELGRFITFAKQLKGIIALLGVPALILIIILFATIAGSKRSDDEEDDDYGFYEYDEETAAAAIAKKNDPLYEPSNEAPASPAFERRKMSIAENFKQKEVNPDSPYQKEREKERTVQFMAQKGAAAGSTAESSFAARNPHTSSSPAPTAETLREEMLRKTVEAERTGTFNIRKPNESVSDNTGILSRDQVAELSGGAPVKPVETKTAVPEVKKSSSPDISDILGKAPRQSSKKPSDMSVDDLLKIIEEEKKKY